MGADSRSIFRVRYSAAFGNLTSMSANASPVNYNGKVTYCRLAAIASLKNVSMDSFYSKIR